MPFIGVDVVNFNIALFTCEYNVRCLAKMSLRVYFASASKRFFKFYFFDFFELLVDFFDYDESCERSYRTGGSRENGISEVTEVDHRILKYELTSIQSYSLFILLKLRAKE